MPEAQPPPAQDDQPLADSPSGWAQRWKKEFAASRDALRQWHDDCLQVKDRFLNQQRPDGNLLDNATMRWGLFTANIQQQRALLFGQTPQVEVARRFDDAPDDVARVGSEMLDRILNEDLQAGHDGTLRAWKHALDDFRLYDFGLARIRYEVDTEKVKAQPAQVDTAGKELAPEVKEHEKTADERCVTDWVHRSMFLWSAGAKVWEDVRWIAFGTEQSRRGLTEAFGEETAAKVPLNSKRTEGGAAQSKENDGKPAEPWQRAVIWEVWDKETRRVFFYSEDMPTTLADKPYPTWLKGLWPCPRPMLFNATTDAYLPRPDYMLAEDLYKKLEDLGTRIKLLSDAIKVRGLYDGTNTGIQRLLKEGVSNDLIPVDNWARHAEMGGLKSMVDWMPLEMITAALAALREEAAATKMDLYEVTGWSDILRGQGVRDDVTATESRTEANFASVRMRAIQDEFARFCSDIQRLRAECICAQFEPERLIERSNVLNTEDKGLAQQAAAFLKDEVSREYRIEVRPEAVSMADFTAQKAERLEVLDAIGEFLLKAGPLAQQVPGSAPTMLKLLQWTLAGLRGARGAEAILDPAITQAEQALAQQAANPQPQQEDPKVQAQRAKMQADQQKAQLDSEHLKLKAQLDVASEAQKQQLQTTANLEEERGRLEMKARFEQQRTAQQVAAGLNKPKPNGVPK